MKIKTIIAAFFLTISFSVFAQADIDAKVKTMTESVGLSKDQQVKYKDYLVRSEKEKKALIEKYKDDTGSEEKKNAQAAYRAKYETEFKKILTADQLAKMKAKNEVGKKK